jgi:hypothetical protein
MARKRIELTPTQEARIDAEMRRGGTAESISRAMGLSRATVGRRMKERKAGKAPKPPSAPAPLPEIPEEIPEGLDLATVDKWIPKVERAAEAAEREENYAAFASLTARLVALLDHKRKATPLPKIDPNDSPDMVAAAERVRKRWHELVKMEMS